MVTQRRYSVTGQTPPDAAEAIKARSPKLQALDTQTTSCGLCEGGAADSDDSGAEQPRGRKMNMAVVRALDPARRRPSSRSRHSCKRSATQLPSPSSPSHELPPKMARYNSLGCTDDAGAMDTDTDSDVTHVCHESDDTDAGLESQTTSLPSTPECWLPASMLSLPDATSLEQLQLGAREDDDGDDEQDDEEEEKEEEDDDDDDECMEAEDYALSVPHSRNHSLDHVHLDDKAVLQQHWVVFQQSLALQEPRATHPEHVEQPRPPSLTVDTTTTTNVSTTFLTLPPEIRHQIYRHCSKLVVDRPLVYCVSTFTGEMQHPLASVSRLVRSEALAIFYSYNTWIIKVEFRMMYEAFQDWIIRLGTGAGLLRIVTLSVRGTLFRPKKKHAQNITLNGQAIQLQPATTTITTNNGTREESYCPPDGEASFKINLSEKFTGGRVQIVRNDGTKEAGDTAVLALGKLVQVLWEKRRIGSLNGQDWIDMVDRFLTIIGGWTAM